MNNRSGFTIVEITIAIVALLAVGGVFYSQQADLRAAHRDTARKTAMNALYATLTEVVKPSIGGYPRILKAEQLTAMDPSLIVDPEGKKINARDSDYQYEPTECNGGDLCKSFTLRARLEREDLFVKRSL